MRATATTGPAAEPSVTPTIAPGQTVPVPGATPSAVDRFFPITVVVETGKAWMQVTSLTRVEDVAGGSEVTVVAEGNVQAMADGVFDYRLVLIDSEDMAYPDSPGILLGPLQEGAVVDFETSIRVPVDATLTRLAFWIVGTEAPKLRYVIDVPVADIPLRSP